MYVKKIGQSAIALFGAALFLQAQPESWERFKLHYTEPATNWQTEALPLGNGRLGAMCFGGIKSARILLNEESIWAGPPYPMPNPDMSKAIPQARELLFGGDYAKAHAVLEAALPERITPRSYQPWGDLTLVFPEFQDKTTYNYRRELDLDRAVATTTFDIQCVTYKREVFASAVDDVVIVRQTASKPGALSMQVSLTRETDFEVQGAGDGTLIMSGQAQHEGKHLGVQWTSMLKAKVEGGTMRVEDDQLSIIDADTVTLYLTCFTDYNRDDTYQPLTRDREAQCRLTLKQAMAKPYSAILSAHIEDHRSFFRRCSLDLGGHSAAATPTNLRLKTYRNAEESGTKSEDLDLVALYFQFGRYLLISSSRPATLPANLQGIWNEDLKATWNSDYHTNINFQMNYWPADITNLSDLQEPFFSFTERLVPNGRKSARINFNAAGFTVPHTTDVWHFSTPMGRLTFGMWPHGGAWCTGHFMETYRYNLDIDFLRERAWPIITEAAKFYLDYLVEDPKTGKLVAGPENSPENRFLGADGGTYAVSMGPAMGQQIVWEVFNNTLEMAEILQIDDHFLYEVRSAIERLHMPQIGADGRLMEWAKPYEENHKGHRHISHLYAVHPGAQYTFERAPEMMEAAWKSLDYRLENGGAGTGWSRAWAINFFARFQDAEKAFENVHALLGSRVRGMGRDFQEIYATNDNLFGMHPPFQIDGNFGGTAGIAEMLMQSHAGSLHLLPALPAAWPNGKVNGLKARGDVELDFEWAEGVLVSVRLKAGENYAPKPLIYAGKRVETDLKPGETKSFLAADFQ
jgi:alpha-L-fucosidase 2